VNVITTYLSIAPRSPEASVLRLLIELGAQVVGADEGSLLVLDEPARELVFAMTVGQADQKLEGQRVPLGQGLTGLAALSREVQMGAPTFHVAGEEAVAGKPQAVIAAPMLIQDSVVGVITAVSFARDKRFGSRDAELYARIGAVAGVVVDQHRRLRAVEALSSAEGGKRAAGAETDAEQIAASVGRLAAARPDALAAVARLLRELEGLVLGGVAPR